jgi:hypothetical protein
VNREKLFHIPPGTTWLWQPDEIREYATGRAELLWFGQLDAGFFDDAVEEGTEPNAFTNGNHNEKHVSSFEKERFPLRMIPS